MDDQGFNRALRIFTRRRPFKPFLIELMSGDRLEVKHPEAVYVSGELIYFIDHTRGARLLQSSSICQFLVNPQAPTSSSS